MGTHQISKLTGYAILMVALLYSCFNDSDKIRAVARQELEKKINAYRLEKIKECRQLALKTAEDIVDSILFNIDIHPINDSIYKPGLPKKPGFIPVDSSVFDTQKVIVPIVEFKS